MPKKDFDKIFSDLFSGELPENKENLKRNVQKEIERISQEAEETLLSKQAEINKPQLGAANRPPTVQRPLTEEESEVVDQKIARLRSKLGSINRKVEFAEKSINAQNQNDQDKSGFVFDISRKPKLRRLTKVLFGQKLSEITFAQYKQMLSEKERLEKEDGNSMFEQEEDDKTSSSAKDFVSLLKKKR